MFDGLHDFPMQLYGCIIQHTHTLGCAISFFSEQKIYTFVSCFSTFVVNFKQSLKNHDQNHQVDDAPQINVAISVERISLLWFNKSGLPKVYCIVLYFPE